MMEGRPSVYGAIKFQALDQSVCSFAFILYFYIYRSDFDFSM